MEVHPSKHLVLINGFTYQDPWFEGHTYTSYKYPEALAERWSQYFDKQILEISQDLEKDYQLMGSTDRTYVFGRHPYGSAIRRIKELSPDGNSGPLLYCGLCNQYASCHEHDCNDSPWDPCNGYPSDAPDTD